MTDHASFVEVRCCGDLIGITNAHPLTPDAVRTFCALQQRVGNAWVDDAEAKALFADPASYTTPADGEPIAFGCTTCGAKFAWAAGSPTKVASS